MAVALRQHVHQRDFLVWPLLPILSVFEVTRSLEIYVAPELSEVPFYCASFGCRSIKDILYWLYVRRTLMIT